ncbi:MAG TPA: acyl-CoA dehydrogenase family protein [Thermoplasmata archaeon]|nr:acyl-CoA dehydrogenase family protein [Thermoplasmata archaeon]
MGPLPPSPADPMVSEIASFVERHRLATRYRELDRSPSFPRAEYSAMGSAGLLGLRTSQDLGGRGLSLPRVGAALFHLSYRSGSVFAKLSLQPEFCSVLADHGSAELVNEWFRPMVRGEKVVGNQITEPGAGSDAQGMALTAAKDGSDYLLTGEKSEVALCMDADAAIVYGRVPSPDPRSGITAFLVPQDLPGITRRPSSGDLGERWQRRGSVTYDRVRLPGAHRIGQEGRGFDYLRAELTQERTLLAAIYLGVAFASWEATQAYSETRAVFGKPLSRQEAVSFPLAQDLGRLSADWLFVEETLRRLEEGQPAVAEAALSKWMAVDDALRAIDHAIQFHGGRGYSQDLPHEQRWRDVRSGSIAHGPAEVMLLVAAHELRERGRRSRASATDRR